MVEITASTGAALSDKSAGAIAAGHMHGIVERIAELEAALRDALNEAREAKRRGAFLAEALREISVTFDETEQTPTKLCAALYAVCRLAEHALQPTV
jgi:hypothetical protein